MWRYKKIDKVREREWVKERGWKHGKLVVKTKRAQEWELGGGDERLKAW